MFRRDVEELRSNMENRYGTHMNLAQVLNQDQIENVEFVLPPVVESTSSEVFGTSEPDSDTPVFELRSDHRNFRTGSPAAAPQMSRAIRRLILERRKLQRQMAQAKSAEQEIDPMEAMKAEHKAMENYLLKDLLNVDLISAEQEDPKINEFITNLFCSSIHEIPNEVQEDDEEKEEKIKRCN